ncbi:MAG TPA: NADPH-dependent FMN reductase [Solirubrobacteraceae bacterium]|nr:NADPH-dependent FMN reductase [Solirubrobacteraceae bacterium]
MSEAEHSAEAGRGPVRLLLVSGSTRGGSTNTSALRTALQVAPAGVEAVLYDGLSELPAFNPDDELDGDVVHPAVASMRAAFAAAEAVLICTPEYAGTLPGSLKNLLDWTVGNGDLYEKPVAWLNVAPVGRGDGAEATLMTVLGYVTADVIEPACRRVTVPRGAVGPDGAIADGELRAALADVLETMAGAVRGPRILDGR